MESADDSTKRIAADVPADTTTATTEEIAASNTEAITESESESATTTATKATTNTTTATSAKSKAANTFTTAPIVEHLTQIYENIYNEEDNEHVSEFENLTRRFSTKYGSAPDFFVRVPGMLYLFGEDPTYVEYPQCNITIERDLIIAYAISSSKEPSTITINSISAAQFPSKTFSYDSNFEEEDVIGNTALLGIKTAIDECPKPLAQLVGIKCMFANNIPAKQTLHHSNALALGMCLMTAHANKIGADTSALLSRFTKFTKTLNLSRSISADYQSIVLHAKQRQGYVGGISSSFAFPRGHKFVIANSLTPEPKMMVANKRKNKRICEQRIAVHLMLAAMDVSNRDEYLTLFDVQKFMDYTTEELIECIDKYIEDKPFSKADIEAELKTDLISILSDIPFSNQVVEANAHFNPHKRAKHILLEALKAQKVKAICSEESSKLSDQDKWREICTLFNASQESIVKNLEAQSDECTRLTKLMKELGCKATKVIGDGWGGSVIGVIEEHKAQKTVEHIMDNYYLNKENPLMVSDDLDNYVFATLPSRGACILNPAYEIWF